MRSSWWGGVGDEGFYTPPATGRHYFVSVRTTLGCIPTQSLGNGVGRDSVETVQDRLVRTLVPPLEVWGQFQDAR